jgi:hypothetical protein
MVSVVAEVLIFMFSGFKTVSFARHQEAASSFSTYKKAVQMTLLLIVFMG